VPHEAAAVHGIKTGDAMEFGISINLALIMFMELYDKADYLVAHNIDFDLRMLRRYAKDPSKDVFSNGLTVNFDTMKAMTPICQLPLTEKQKYAKKYNPNIGDYKQPNLSECIWHLFTEELDGAHDAMVDVEACKEVFYYLKKEGKLI
jgi:DNA polymerase-3 subunit epsilon